jgi:hypothetical protein
VKVLPQRQQYLGYAAHAYAADADEMYVPYSSKQHLFFQGSGARGRGSGRLKFEISNKLFQISNAYA